MCFIWKQAFIDDYEAQLPDDPVEVIKIHVGPNLSFILLHFSKAIGGAQ